MTWAEYEKSVMRTAQSNDEAMLNFALGLSGEVGEVLELIKKHRFHGHTMDVQALEKELGDVLWYLTAVAKVWGLDLEGIAEKNKAKLERRYPDGFDKEASHHNGT